MSEFLSKVYDKYKEEDFSYGDDNLNPKREITVSDDMSTREKEEMIYSLIGQRIQKVKEDLAKSGIDYGITLEEETDEPIDVSLMGESNARGPSTQQRLSIARLGGSDENSFLEIPKVSTLNPEPYIVEIELLISKIMIGSSPPPDGTPTPPDPKEFPDFDIFPTPNICSDEDANNDAAMGYGSGNSGNSGDGSNSSGGNGSGNDSNEDGDNENEDGDGDGEGNGDGDGNGSGSTGIDYINGFVEAERSSIEMEISQCALKELGILRVILCILQVISVLREIISYVLSIILPIIDIVQLAAGAWLNPTNIGKIANRVVSRVIALLISVISGLIQSLFDMLNLDCITAATGSLISAILEALAGIQGAVDDIDVCSVAMNDAVVAGMDVAEMLGDSVAEWKNFGENISKGFDVEGIKKQLNQAKDTLAESAGIVKGKDGNVDWKSSIKNMAVTKTGAQNLIDTSMSGLRSSWDMVQGMGEQFKNMGSLWATSVSAAGRNISDSWTRVTSNIETVPES